MSLQSMALAAPAPGVARLARGVTRTASQIQLKQRSTVTGYKLQHCALFGKVRGRIMTAADIVSYNRGLKGRSNAVCATACPRGPAQDMVSETLRLRHVEMPGRTSRCVRANAGRNKKWRTADKGRLEGNKRTRGNGKPQPPSPPGKDGAAGEEKKGSGERVGRVKPKKGPKPKDRVSWAGQDMLMLNPGERHKIGQEITPWASVRTERMPDDYYKYGPFGPHAWKGVTVGSPRKGTLADDIVVFFSTVENEEEHEQGDIQDAITGYSKRVDQMDEQVGIQYFFAFARQVQKVPDQKPWEEWTLVAQVTVESGEDVDKWTLGEKLDRSMFENLTKCVAWARPDLIYVKRPAYQMRFEPQQEFIEGWLELLNPDKGHSDYFQRICSLLGVEGGEEEQEVGTAFDGLSEARKMEVVEHVLTAHPVWLLYPFTVQALQAEQQQKSMLPVSETEEGEEEAEWAEDAPSEDDPDEEVDDELAAFNGEYGEDFEFDEQDDVQSSESDFEKEALAAEAALGSTDAEPVDVDDEYWNEQAVKGYAEIGMRSTKEKEIVESEAETQEQEVFLEAAVRPFTYTNLIQEAFTVRRTLEEYADLRSWSR